MEDVYSRTYFKKNLQRFVNKFPISKYWEILSVWKENGMWWCEVSRDLNSIEMTVSDLLNSLNIEENNA